MNTDMISRLADQATARDQVIEAADAAPLQRVRDQLAPAMTTALTHAAHGRKVAEQRLPALQRALGVLSRPAYRRIAGLENVNSAYSRQRFVDDTREALRDLIRTLEENPKAIEQRCERIRNVRRDDLALVDYVPGNRRVLEEAAYGLQPANLEAAFARIDERLARIDSYGVDDGVTAAPVTAPALEERKPRQARATSSTARAGA